MRYVERRWDVLLRKYVRLVNQTHTLARERKRDDAWLCRGDFLLFTPRTQARDSTILLLLE